MRFINIITLEKIEIKREISKTWPRAAPAQNGPEIYKGGPLKNAIFCPR